MVFSTYSICNTEVETRRQYSLCAVLRHDEGHAPVEIRCVSHTSATLPVTKIIVNAIAMHSS